MLEELISQNESKTLEFKESTKSLSTIIKTVIAFANTAGGTIIIGIKDRTKELIGVPNSLDEEERLINAISDSVAPLLIPDIEIQTYKKKEFIIINIPHIAGPYYLKSAGPQAGVYVRIGSTSRIADHDMHDNLKLFSKKISYDEIPFAKYKKEDLDWPAS